MNFEITNGYNKAFLWIEVDNIRFIGYLNNQKNLFPNSNDLRVIFAGCVSDDDYKRKIEQLNGVFSIIIYTQEWLIAASDSTRFFPIFYTIQKNEFYIGDNINIIREKTNTKEIDNVGKIEFLTAAFTGSHRTLFDKVSQIRPMELITVRNNKINTGYYGSFSQSTSDTSTRSHEYLMREAKNTIDKVFKRLFERLKDNKIALPLSCGYDSRLIACKLKEYGFKDVVCFTYGRKTKEVEISRKVAEALNFSWYFVEYTPELIHDFPRTITFLDYYNYAARGTSMFFLQEYPALKYLVEQKILSEEYYALPGHSGDLLRGAMLVKSYPVNAKRKDLPQILLKQKYVHVPLSKSDKKILKQQLQNHINELDADPSLLPYSLLEDWEMKERTAKYIFNSSHVFTYFGIKTIFSIWDRDLIEFFRVLPSEERIYDRLYKEVLIKEYFIPNKVWFHDELHPTPFATLVDHFKKILRPHLPVSVKEKLLVKNDWPFYGPMTQYLLDELNDQDIYPVSNGSAYLYRILNWYLMKIK